MKHIVFALFETEEAAAAAIHDLTASGMPKEHVSLIVRRDALDEYDTVIEESDAGPAMGRGVLIGGAIGTVFGLLLGGPFGLLGAGPLASALFGAGAGSLYGAFGGALAGASVTDGSLDTLAQGLREGRILVTARTEDLDVERDVMAIFADHGAVESTKGLL